MMRGSKRSENRADRDKQFFIVSFFFSGPRFLSTLFFFFFLRARLVHIFISPTAFMFYETSILHRHYF